MDWIIVGIVGSGCCSGLKEDCILFSIFLDLEPWILINAIVDQEQIGRGYRRKGHSRGGPGRELLYSPDMQITFENFVHALSSRR